MTIDSATTEFLAASAEAAGPDAKPMWEMTPEEARAQSAAMAEMYGSGPDMHRVNEETLTGTDGGTFRVRTLVPSESPDAIIVYFHGGGWVVADIDDFDTLGRNLAKKTNAAVVMVNYRKAPELPFPTAVEDSWLALQWASENREAIAGGQVPIIVGGDSAGGNLSAAITLRSRERSGPVIDLQILIYPVTDADFTRGSYAEEENQTLLATETMRWFWDLYVPNNADRMHHEASPIRASSLEGLPPAVVLTAAHDVLRDEGEAYAQALEAAGVPVQHRRFDGQMHGFFQMVNVLPGSAEGLEYVAEAVRGHIGQKAAS